MANISEIAKSAEYAAQDALRLSAEIKNNALSAVAEAIEKNKNEILSANATDLEKAKQTNISQSLLNRLKLDENKLRDMVQGIKDIVKLPDPVNQVLWQKDIADGITLKKVSCPIGVIGVIFEARPDVISQISALAIKSSNAVILKGGTEAEETNKTIFGIIEKALSGVEKFPKI